MRHKHKASGVCDTCRDEAAQGWVPIDTPGWVLGQTLCKMGDRCRFEYSRQPTGEQGRVGTPAKFGEGTTESTYNPQSSGAKIRASVFASIPTAEDLAANEDALRRAVDRKNQINWAGGNLSRELTAEEKADLKAVNAEIKQLKAASASSRERFHAALKVDDPIEASAFFSKPGGSFDRVAKPALDFVASVTSKKAIRRTEQAGFATQPNFPGRAAYMWESPELKRPQIALYKGAEEKTVVHEAGHHIERMARDSDEGLDEKVKAFLDRRCGDEPLAPLPGLRSEKEVGRIDKFLDPYVGRHYPRSSEVISMGIQWLYQDPAWFAKNDPDMFDFIVAFLRGELP